MLKKTISVFAILCIFSLLTFGVSAASEEYYIFSSIYNSDKWEPEEGEEITTIQDAQYNNPGQYPQYKYAVINSKDKTAQQGVNGFYYMYSFDYNKGGSFNVSTLKECIWGKNTTYSAYSRSDSFWCPDVSTVNTKYSGNFWWKISEDGLINPWTEISAAVKWVAPADGKYKLDVKVKNGYTVPDPTWMDDIRNTSDGNYAMIYYNNTKLFSQEAKHMEIPSNTYKKEFTQLKKGDAIYFIADQRVTPFYDFTQWKVKITRYIEDVSSSGASSSVAESSSVVSESAVSSSDISSDISSSEVSSASSAVPVSSQRPWGLIIGIGVAVIILAGGGVGLYFFLKNRNKPVA